MPDCLGLGFDRHAIQGNAGRQAGLVSGRVRDGDPQPVAIRQPAQLRDVAERVRAGRKLRRDLPPCSIGVEQRHGPFRVALRPILQQGKPYAVRRIARLIRAGQVQHVRERA